MIFIFAYSLKQKKKEADNPIPNSLEILSFLLLVTAKTRSLFLLTSGSQLPSKLIFSFPFLFDVQYSY